MPLIPLLPGRAWARPIGQVLLAIGLVVLAGCASTGSSVRSDAGGIQALNVITMPMALNLDAKAGADGIAMRLFASTRSPKTVMITEGKVDILLYDGALTSADLTNAQPIFTWSYLAKELQPFLFSAAVGTGYDLTLNWGEHSPKSNRATIVTRYTPPQGPPIASSPSSVMVAN